MAAAELPNNLGPTLLIVAGCLLSPLLVGIPLALLGVSQLRGRNGRRTYPNLMPAWR